ncbi:MAG: hypothetical protein R3F35_11665 [Myxococcota bacterium]
MSEPASISIGCLSIRVLKRQFEESQDFWDGNWLLVHACCETETARVVVSGPILHLGELQSFRRQLSSLHRDLTGEATLDCIEPNLQVTIRAVGSLGHLESKIELTGNHLLERHEFREEFDQSYLSDLLADLRAIFLEFPIRSPRDDAAA